MFALLMFGCDAAFGQGYVPPKGFVPDEKTAISIARAVLLPVYGARIIHEEEPLTAVKREEFWIVSGTLQCAPNCVGGVAEVRISARDGRVLYMMHGK
jgi:hypothetical protein